MTHHDDSDVVRVRGGYPKSLIDGDRLPDDTPWLGEDRPRPKVPDSVIITDDDVKIDGASVPWHLATDGPRFEKREGVEGVVWLPVLVFTDTTTVGIHSRKIASP
jgi:hypothetical protein